MCTLNTTERDVQMNGSSDPSKGSSLHTHSNSNGNNHNHNHSTDDTQGLPPPSTVSASISKINQPQSLASNLSHYRSSSSNSSSTEIGIGSLPGLVALLHTSTTSGITASSAPARRRLYGSNSLPASPRDSWLDLFVSTFTDDECVQILMVAALVSLAVGMYDDPSTGYVEGMAILAACLIVSTVTATNDYQKETQFRNLSNESEDNVDILVIRDGTHVHLPVTDIVVGDLITIEAGDAIPCDGVLVRSDGLEMDESALTGEPIDVPKDIDSDPFVLSGCTVSAGTAQFVAIAVGRESQWGVIKAALEKEQDQTPLQEKLDAMANLIGKFGIGAAIATFVAMMVMKLYVQPSYLADVTVFSHALDAFIIGVTIVVVAVPEGLPLAVTISLAYSTKKMLADNNLIRHLQACETMGNATNICSDKTGTLTQNRMTVVRGVFANVVHDDIIMAPESGGTIGTGTVAVDGSVSHAAKEIILQGIATCSTARILEKEPPQQHDGEDGNGNANANANANGTLHIVGNKTEGALLLLADSPFFQDDYSTRRANANFGNPGGSRLFPFSSKNKRMSVLVKNNTNTNTNKDKDKDNDWTLYHKGAGEIVLQDCTSYLDADGSVQIMTDAKRQEFERTITSYASQALRCVALAHRRSIDAIVHNPESVTADECRETCEKELTLDALVGIVDPLRPDVVDAVETCQKAGIFVRMVTGDNLETANAIAKQAGILTKGGVSMVGEDFRKLTPSQLDAVLPKLQVLARSSPEDKHILVERLNGGLMPKTKEEWLEAHPGRDWDTEKDLLLPGYYDEWAATRNGVGEVVGVTGDGTNDGPALKAADVGLSMGISGTDVAKNASDIVIMDDNFSSIVKAVLWGRSVFDNIRKFLQFQLTVNVVALTITFLSAVAGYQPPLNAVMMLWVNLIMDTMGALALGTEPPTPELLLRRPYKRDASLINLPMWRNILAQSSYQLGLLIWLLREGPEVFGCESGSTHHFTILFNAFVFCQVFNEFNAREIGDVFNPFKNLAHSPMFLAVIFFTIFAQWVIVDYGGDFTQTTPLSSYEWKITCMLGAVSIPVGYIMRLIPVNEDPESFAGLVGKDASASLPKASSPLTLFILPVAAAIGYKVLFD